MAGNRPLEKRLMNIEKNIALLKDEVQEMNGKNNPILLEMDTCPNTKEALTDDEE